MRGWKTRGEGIIRGLGRVSTPPFHYRPLFLLLGLLRWIHYIGPMVQRGHRDAWLGQYPDSCITRETMDSVWRGDTILVYMLQVYIYIYMLLDFHLVYQCKQLLQSQLLLMDMLTLLEDHPFLIYWNLTSLGGKQRSAGRQNIPDLPFPASMDGMDSSLASQGEERGSNGRGKGLIGLARPESSNDWQRAPPYFQRQ